jgi:ABC-type multidrug transport system fused ATPase/permease subunit
VPARDALRNRFLDHAWDDVHGDHLFGGLIPSLSHGINDVMEEFTANYLPLDVRVKGAQVVLKNGKCILDSVDADFDGGSLVAVMGPSGAGKTTFVSAVCQKIRGFADVHGDIRVGGLQHGLDHIPLEIGFVPSAPKWALILFEEFTKNLYVGISRRKFHGNYFMVIVRISDSLHT